MVVRDVDEVAARGDRAAARVVHDPLVVADPDDAAVAVHEPVLAARRDALAVAALDQALVELTVVGVDEP